MISHLKNEDGYIYAYIEWDVVDELGKTKNHGEYIFIEDLWIHPEYRFKTLGKLIYLINEHRFTENAKYVYWTNLKHGVRLSRLGNRFRLAKKGVKND